jgi:hypothetical protein
LFESDDADLAQWVHVLDTKQWPEDINSQFRFSKIAITRLSGKRQLNVRDVIHGSHEYLTEKMVPEICCIWKTL